MTSRPRRGSCPDAAARPRRSAARAGNARGALSDQRVAGTPRLSGRAPATVMIRPRCSAVIRRGRPPRGSGSSELNPRSLNAWMTLRACDSSLPTSAAICCGLIRVADAQQINARSRLTSEDALRESRLSRLPRSGNSSLTNTDAGRIATSKLEMRPSSPRSGDFRSTDTRRASGLPLRRRRRGCRFR